MFMLSIRIKINHFKLDLFTICEIHFVCKLLKTFINITMHYNLYKTN